jgi:hypothetical protein
MRPFGHRIWLDGTDFSLEFKQLLLISSENFAQKLIMKGGANFSNLFLRETFLVLTSAALKPPSPPRKQTTE